MVILSVLCRILGLLVVLAMLLAHAFFNRMASSNARLGSMGVGV